MVTRLPTANGLGYIQEYTNIHRAIGSRLRLCDFLAIYGYTATNDRVVTRLPAAIRLGLYRSTQTYTGLGSRLRLCDFLAIPTATAWAIQEYTNIIENTYIYIQPHKSTSKHI